MTVFDYAFLTILALSAAVGLWRGLVSEILAMVGWIVALLVAWLYADNVARLLVEVIADRGWRMVAAFALVVVAVLLFVSLLRFLLREMLKAVG
ncbi:MAG: CvpA family protein, partial [Azoarcus sp.]|nr:CvpA family protein [Azoarcus sp.]